MEIDILDFERVVPKHLLDFYLDKLQLEADRRNIESMYDAINNHNASIVNNTFSKYQYAGRTAVNIFEEISLPAGFLKKEKFIELLKLELGSEIIYQEFRPPLSEKPQINYVEDRGDKILIRFINKGKERRLRDGYDIRTFTSVNFELAIIHFYGPILIELRCAYNMHNKFLSYFEDLFRLVQGYEKHKYEWFPITRVSNPEAEQIARILSAGLVEADHKDDGIYDRHIVTASPTITDLRQEEKYIEEFKNKMLLSQCLVIDYTEKTSLGDYPTKIKFKINLISGFQFLSKVSEPVIDYVMGVFLDIRYNRGKNL